ncbi:MAG: phosphomannose isomerase type II C-terminal cupin domain [Candidatus Pacebacteria bacterium]|nr:phosphomannose isomerase type II C-terminal cupin domain [Candidatus Paceibacterota bacterium]
MTHTRPTPYEETRPWGKFRQFTHNDATTVKIITVSQGKKLSLQSHRQRSEYWRVLKGSVIITIGSRQHHARADEEFWIPVGTVHRLEGVGQHNEVLEIAFGTFDENDIIRHDDEWGRK